MAGAEKRNITKSKIVNYIINHEATSKVELSKDLNLSMPTVLSNVNELLANGIAVETGEYESTGEVVLFYFPEHSIAEKREKYKETAFCVIIPVHYEQVMNCEVFLQL